MKKFVLRGEGTETENGFIKYKDPITALKIKQTFSQIFEEFPNALIIDSIDDATANKTKRPEIFIKDLEYEKSILAEFHSGESGIINTGIIIDRKKWQEIIDAFFWQYDESIFSQEMLFFTKENFETDPERIQRVYIKL
jgi:hypothetical protein